MNTETNKAKFKSDVIDSSLLSVVQFKAEWSGTCQILEPVYRELAKTYRGIVNFFTVDIEKESSLEKEYGVMDVPTILFFKSGLVVDHTRGLVTKNALVNKIENALAAGGN